MFTNHEIIIVICNETVIHRSTKKLTRISLINTNLCAEKTNSISLRMLR